jgi:outer membrane protein insertion porin family
MRTERREAGGRRRGFPAALVTAALAASALGVSQSARPVRLAAQSEAAPRPVPAAPIRVTGDTEVGSIRFTFLDRRTFSASRLEARLALHAPGTFEFLPFHSSGPFPFTPLELQRDVARLRLFYRRAGFSEAEIAYAVRHDVRDNEVHVEFRIREGEPLLRGSLEVVDDSGADPETWLPDEMRSDWRALLSSVEPREGERIGESERTGLEERISGWLQNRGYPFARAAAHVQPPSDGVARADVAVEVTTGTRARVGEVVVSGTRELEEDVITRELPYGVGDWYSAERLAEGERELFGLDLVRVALSDPARLPAADSLVGVRVRVEENLPHVISGQLGYATESGISAQTDWAHRNFMGGARTFSASLQARTGLLAIGSTVQRLYAASTSLKQPYFFGRRRSLVLTPHVEYRDDFRDRSIQFGGEAIVLHQWGTLRTVSVHLTATRRHIFDFRVTGNEGVDFRDVLAVLDTLDHDVRTGTIGLSLNWGRVDDPVAPRTGYLLRGGGEVTGPRWTSSAQFARLEASVAGFVPFSERTGLVLRLAGGRLIPFGASIPATENDKTVALLRLRDVLFTAGGRYDVRGWGEQQLGPKFPDVRLASTDPDTVLVAESYVPLGGLARAIGSTELRLPLPGASPQHSTHVFVDAGRVWTPDDRFDVSGIPESELRFGIGTGVELGTPVGLFRVSVGYKLNPSPFDVRDPEAVFAALSAGGSVFDVPTKRLRRWHLHVAIGQVY